MAYNGKARKYKVKAVNNSNGNVTTTIYSMLPPETGELTPNGYQVAYNTVTELGEASTTHYMTQLDSFLAKCGLNTTQIADFKSIAEYDDSICVTVILLDYGIVGDNSSSGASSSWSINLKWDRHPEAHSYTVEYRTNAIGWTNYTTHPINPDGTYWMVSNVPNNDFAEPWIRIRAYSSGGVIIAWKELQLQTAISVVPPDNRYAKINSQVLQNTSYDEYGDPNDGTVRLWMNDTYQVPAGYDIQILASRHPEYDAKWVSISSADTPLSMMQKIFGAANITTTVNPDSSKTYYIDLWFWDNVTTNVRLTTP
jgi:hypothetical protein